MEGLEFSSGPMVWFRNQLRIEVEKTFAKNLGCDINDLNYAYFRCSCKSECDGSPENHHLVWCGKGLVHFIKKALKTPRAYELLVTSSKTKGGMWKKGTEDPIYGPELGENHLWMGDVADEDRTMVCGSDLWLWLWDSYRLGLKKFWKEIEEYEPAWRSR